MHLLCILTNLLWVLAKWLQHKSAKLLVALLGLLAEVACGRATGKHMLVALMAKGKDRGHTRAGGAGQPAATGSLAKYIRQQRRKRWHRHLQRLAGSKQNWEILAFAGLSGVKSLADAQTNPYSDDDAEAAPKVSREEQRSLRRAKAEARSGYNEGKRLAEKRDMVLRDKGALLLTDTQTAMLKKFDDGSLRHNMNQAIAKTGHGQLVLATGETLDIGGITGGGSRRIIDAWYPPDWRQVLQDGMSPTGKYRETLPR